MSAALVCLKCYQQTIRVQIIYIQYIYMYKQDLALNNRQGLIYHKIQTTNPPTNQNSYNQSNGIIILLTGIIYSFLLNFGNLNSIWGIISWNNKAFYWSSFSVRGLIPMRASLLVIRNKAKNYIKIFPCVLCICILYLVAQYETAWSSINDRKIIFS